MRQNKYDKRESKYRAWFNEREKAFKNIFLNLVCSLLLGQHLLVNLIRSTSVMVCLMIIEKFGMCYGIRFLANQLITLTQNTIVSVVVKRFLLAYIATEMVKLKILETDWRMNNASFDE